MEFSPELAQGQLQRRYKRFLADIIDADGQPRTIHCPNTGAMLGCADPGSVVWYSDSNNSKRKYRHTLEAVVTNHGIAGVNTARANRLVEEALTEQRLTPLASYTQVTREAKIPETLHSAGGRFDFCLQNTATDEPLCYVEVKNVTYATGAPGSGVGLFPDAVSTRALRHLEALVACQRAGLRAVLLFCVQHSGIKRVSAAVGIYPEYAAALSAAAQEGVEVLAYSVAMSPTRFILSERLSVDF